MGGRDPVVPAIRFADGVHRPAIRFHASGMMRRGNLACPCPRPLARERVQRKPYLFPSAPSLSAPTCSRRRSLPVPIGSHLHGSECVLLGIVHYGDTRKAHSQGVARSLYFVILNNCAC